MSLSVKIDVDNAVRVHLGGRLDSNTAPELDKSLKELLAPGTHRAVVFDLAQLEYISSAGLRSIVRVNKVMTAVGGHTLLVNLRSDVEKVFNMVKVLPAKFIFRSIGELNEFLSLARKGSNE